MSSKEMTQLELPTVTSGSADLNRDFNHDLNQVIFCQTNHVILTESTLCKKTFNTRSQAQPLYCLKLFL